MSATTETPGLFSKEMEGVWYLLSIPGFMIIFTIIGALIHKALTKRRKQRTLEIHGSVIDHQIQDIENHL